MSGCKYKKKEKKISPYKCSRENSFLCPNIFADPRRSTRAKLKNIEHHKVYYPKKSSAISRYLPRRRLSATGEIIKFWYFCRNRVYHNIYWQTYWYIFLFNFLITIIISDMYITLCSWGLRLQDFFNLFVYSRVRRYDKM